MTKGTKRVLTGVKPTGVPHIGNLLGAIGPALELARTKDCFLFIADLHALTIRPEPARVQEESYCVAATYLSFGLDPERTVFYRQSDVPEITQLAWCLSCVLPKGMLNRAHSYKDALSNKGQSDEDINHGVYAYPVLMAADILAFDADEVPVGKDQKQHLEIAQEAARKMNHLYGGDVLRVPDALIDEAVMTIPGTDGRKMSKSYDNTIQLFVTDKQLKKAVMGVTTDSTEYGQPLPTKNDTVLSIYKHVASAEDYARLLAQYASGRRDPNGPDAEDNYFGWGNAKGALVEALKAKYAKEREAYNQLMADRGHIDELLAAGAVRARDVAAPVVDRVFRAMGIRPPA
ncbi:MAG: tryptophan--tRNA ligase [Deltaproteobacteria bacterium]